MTKKNDSRIKARIVPIVIARQRLV
jgi:hypothetical protein